jgi:serine-type D-Ala-D-Ala carboxypeptidase/endopeptidase
MVVDQSIPDGSYEGRLGNLQVILHLLWNGGGSPLLTIDGPDQGIFGLECVDVTIAGRALKFTVPLVKGTWSGALEADDLALSGTWIQGSASPLRFVRNIFVASATPSVVDGVWLGQLDVDMASLRVQLIVKTDHRRRLLATLDSIDQRKTGLACTNVFFDNDRLSFEVPYVHGRWAGTLSPDRSRLLGRWTQKSDRAFDFERQARATSVLPLPPPRMLPGLPPVPVAELGALLSRDFGDALQNGLLASGSPGGAVIGISQGGERSIVAFGVANAGSIFEIGSVSKTLTGLLLAQMVAQGKVDLHDPIGQLLQF